jgi:hypothetical protein
MFTKAYSNFQDLSRNWAILALTNSAEQLRSTADFLTSLSSKLATNGKPATESEVQTPAETPPAKA